MGIIYMFKLEKSALIKEFDVFRLSKNEETNTELFAIIITKDNPDIQDEIVYIVSKYKDAYVLVNIGRYDYYSSMIERAEFVCNVNESEEWQKILSCCIESLRKDEEQDE